MFKRYFTAPLILFWSAFLPFACASQNRSTDVSDSSGLKVVNRKKSFAEAYINDRTKALIIREMFRDINKKDHAVTDDGSLYLSVTESVFDLLPKVINGVKLVLFNETSDVELKVANITFSEWSRDGKIIRVTSVANFYGGNKGGCNYNFRLTGEEWMEEKRDCFAMHVGRGSR